MYLSVFSKDPENMEEVKEKLVSLVPFDLETEKVPLNHETASGLTDNKIDILDIMLLKNKHIKKTFKYILDQIGKEQVKTLFDQLESRFDENLYFFLRLDKTELMKGNFVLTDGGNCFHIKLGVCAYPAKRELGAEIMTKVLNEYLE